jgi:hypothetical protein
MKKYFIQLIILLSCINSFAQVKEIFPKNFHRANVTETFRNHTAKIPIHPTEGNSGSQINVQPNSSKGKIVNSILASSEDIIGYTFYDLQTNHSISNNLVVNLDGTISGAWNFSPNAIVSSNPPYPYRGSGYNYLDGNAWAYPLGPNVREETVRTGFTNIVVTPTHELLVAHYAAGLTDSNRIIITRRAGKGSGAWDAPVYPWGTGISQSWPKACSGITNENVYVIFLDARNGNSGHLYFASSTDGGGTWSAAVMLPDIDSTYYRGFGGDSYSIDAKGDTVAISYGDIFTDVGLLKSTDAGQTWTKSIIQLHPQPFYTEDSLTDINHDGIVDTINSNGGDSKVLIDNNGMCHVWFSAFSYFNSVAGDGFYNPMYGTDNLYYWNETMSQNNGYVAIASAQDFNGNGFLDLPVDTSTNCVTELPWGQYGGGITQMPSAGIDSLGRIYLSYQTIDELADTTFYHEAHRHIYMMTLPAPYNPADWTTPYDIVPSYAAGGNGEDEEAVFACTAKNVTGGFAYVLYQRDGAPGHGLAATGTCDNDHNLGNISDIVLARQDINQLINPPGGSNVWPGDANYDLLVDNYDLLYIGIANGDTGFVRPGASIAFVPQSCQDWSYQFSNGINVKRADSDGNGIIEPADTTAVSQNYGLTHPFRIARQTKVNSTGEDLILQLPAVALPGTSVNIPIVLGTINPISDVYGLAFTINYDNTSVDPGSMSIDFSGSWIESGNNHLSLVKDFPSSGKCEVAFTRIDGTNISGMGQIGNLNFIVGNNSWGFLHLLISNVKLISHDEIEIPVATHVDSIFTSVNDLNNINMSIFPNPSIGDIYVGIKNNEHISYQFSVFNMKGQELSVNIFAGDVYTLKREDFNPGIYLLTMTNLKTGSRSQMKIVFL